MNGFMYIGLYTLHVWLMYFKESYQGNKEKALTFTQSEKEAFGGFLDENGTDNSLLIFSGQYIKK